MTNGERIVWAAHWAQAWEAGAAPSECARLAAKAVEALRGASLPDDPAAAAMLREMRGEVEGGGGMSERESVRDWLARRAREIRHGAEVVAEPFENTKRIATARALEEVVAALDGKSAWLAGIPGGEDARRTLDTLADGANGAEDVSPGGSS